MSKPDPKPATDKPKPERDRNGLFLPGSGTKALAVGAAKISTQRNSSHTIVAWKALQESATPERAKAFWEMVWDQALKGELDWAKLLASKLLPDPAATAQLTVRLEGGAAPVDMRHWPRERVERLRAILAEAEAAREAEQAEPVDVTPIKQGTG